MLVWGWSQKRPIKSRVKRKDLAENNALSDCQKLVERNENIIFVFLVPAVHVKLPDVVDAQLLFLQLDLVGIWGKFRGECSDMVREGGREEDDLETFAREKAWQEVSERFKVMSLKRMCTS